MSLFCCLFCNLSWADNQYDVYQFTTPSQTQQFDQLTHEMRCLVCQNETLADSGAPLASDLRNQIAIKIKQGASNKQIINYLVSRYGDFILYKPQFKNITYILWFAPLLLLLLGILVWWKIVKEQKAMSTPENSVIKNNINIISR